MINKTRFGLLGSGSWSTAVATILLENVEQINWYIRSKSSIDHIKKHGNNPKHLSSVSFRKDQVNMSDNIRLIVEKSDVIILGIPSPYIIEELGNTSFENKTIISLIKGLIPSKNKTISQYFRSKYKLPLENILTLLGPSHAEEIAEKKVTYLTLSCKNKSIADSLSQDFSSKFVKMKTSNDIIGNEYASTLKNIYAISSGIVNGLGYGDNFKAVLISNCVREMEYFLEKVNTSERNITGSQYLGDLLVTAYSNFSRNRLFGSMIGKGYTVKSAILEMSVTVEGYYGANAVKAICKKKKIEAPIINGIYDILYRDRDPKKVFSHISNLLK